MSKLTQLFGAAASARRKAKENMATNHELNYAIRMQRKELASLNGRLSSFEHKRRNQPDMTKSMIEYTKKELRKLIGSATEKYYHLYSKTNSNKLMRRNFNGY